MKVNRPFVSFNIAFILAFLTPVAGVWSWEPTKPIEFVIPAGTGGGAE